MEIDVTKSLRKKIYRAIIFFLVIVFCTSFFLLHSIDRSDELTVSDAHLVCEQSSLQAANPLIVRELHTEKGAYIAQGALLVTVQNVLSDEEYARLQKNVELAQTNVEQIRYGAAAVSQKIPLQTESLDAARVRMDLMNELYEMGAVSAAKRNEAVAAYEQEKNALTVGSEQNPGAPNPAAIQAAEEQLKRAEEALAKVRDNTSTTDLFATREGTVSQIFVKEGDRIEKGDDILSVNILENCWIEAAIPSDGKDRVYLGQIVRYELNGISVQGTVEEIVDADPENGNEEMVRISVPLDKTASDGENIVLHFSS